MITEREVTQIVDELDRAARSCRETAIILDRLEPRKMTSKQVEDNFAQVARCMRGIAMAQEAKRDATLLMFAALEECRSKIEAFAEQVRLLERSGRRA